MGNRWAIPSSPVPTSRLINAPWHRILYAKRGRSSYFLDYSNFRENTIPGGWNDGWSGEFELLNASWYNASNYYVRGNFTYETPLLAVSWLPLVGHYIEMERIYVSALSVKSLHPYLECGYGFTTRLFSVGAIRLKSQLEIRRLWLEIRI